MSNSNADVVVVGAGFAGLAAARDLVRARYDVVVLEARDRVGGRSYAADIAGVPVDLGASFVGPTQDEVIRLAAELGCATVATRDDGENLIRWRGRVRSYRGTIPRLSWWELADLGRVRWQFGRLASAVGADRPWEAAHLDDRSLGEWLASVRATRSTRDLMAIVSRVTWGAEPDEVSLLHAAFYVGTAGGLDRMLDTRGGAQQDHFPGSAHAVATRMADELGARVRLSSPVHEIAHRDDGVTVTVDGGRVDARHVIVAVAPEHRGGITFSPAFAREHEELARHWPQGSLSKAYAAYDEPFWRRDGRSGQSLSDTGPAFITFDVSPADGPGVLLGFTDARAYDDLPPERRRADVLECFAALFGERARDPIDFLEQRWAAEPFAPGGPTAAVPPGSWTSYGQYLREPVGRIHWAGTETAVKWSGFLDGAVRSGRRAAAEVAARL